MWTAASAPRGRSCTVSNCHVANPMPYHQKCGARDLFQTNFFAGMFFKLFFLHGRKSKRTQITGTKIIFKQKKNIHCLSDLLKMF